MHEIWCLEPSYFARNEEEGEGGLPRNPEFGVSRSGSAISALTPHTIVVSPRRTKDEPSAVEIEP